MLATPAPLPVTAGWAYEFKWDGIRAIAEVSGGRLRMYSRSGADITVAYPELAAACRTVPDGVYDGEVVVFDSSRPDGAEAAAPVPAFEALAERMHVRDAARAARLAARHPVTYLVFDLLRLDGTVLVDLPYRRRRAALEDLALAGPRWVVPPMFDSGAATLQVSRDSGLEGVVAKRLDSPYRPGVRSPDWVKVKHVNTDDLVVGGFRRGARPIGSLLVGEAGPAGLTYRGRVGGGISESQQRRLAELLEPLRRPDPPFADAVPAEDARGAVWVLPTIVVEVAYGNRTADGRLRFPRLRRIRTDLEA